MAKRFTDTNKYKKPFIRSLPGAYKLLWDFLYHDCDYAGIWIVDFEIAQMYLGSDMIINKQKAIELFNSDEVRIIELEAGKKWFIPSFILFQYVKLSEKNKAHQNVILILKKFNLLKDDNSLKDFGKELVSPLEGDKEKEMEQEEEKEKEMEEEKAFGKFENLLLVPEMLRVFKIKNTRYHEDRQRDSKPLLSIAKFLCEQGGLGGSPTLHTDKVLEAWELLSTVVSQDNFYKTKSLSTISNHIQEITQISLHGKKKNENTKSKSKTVDIDDVKRAHARRYGSG